MIRQIIEEQPVNKDFSVDDIVKLYEERFRKHVPVRLYTKTGGHSPGAGERRATSRLYQSLGNSFLSFFGKNIRIDEINEKLIRLYEEYLMAKKLMDNTISFYMRNFRAIMNKAAASGLIKECTHFFKKRLKIPGSKKHPKRTIEEKVIRKIKNLSDAHI